MAPERNLDIACIFPSMELFAAVITLFLIMDPLGNIPIFLSVLQPVDPARRRVILIREILIAYVVLLVFFFLGEHLLRLLHLDQETISIAGGIVLFLIALRMVFPPQGGMMGDNPEGEPFVVPLAIPLIAGPSTLAAVLLLQRSAQGSTIALLGAMTIAWALSAVILLSSTFFYRILRERGLIAMERLMGMLLVMVSVQMVIGGLKALLNP